MRSQAPFRGNAPRDRHANLGTARWADAKEDAVRPWKTAQQPGEPRSPATPLVRGGLGVGGEARCKAECCCGEVIAARSRALAADGGALTAAGAALAARRGTALRPAGAGLRALLPTHKQRRGMGTATVHRWRESAHGARAPQRSVATLVTCERGRTGSRGGTSAGGRPDSGPSSAPAHGCG